MMTSETGEDDPNAVGGEQRPHITLDLKATEVPADQPRAAKPQVDAETAEQPKAAESDMASNPLLEGQPQPEPDVISDSVLDDSPQQPEQHEKSGVGAVLTHIAAGAFGALLALGIGYAALRTADDAPSASPNPETPGLSARLEAADQRIAILERSAASADRAPAQNPALQALQGELSLLNRDLSQLAGRQGRAENQPAGLTEASAETLQQSIAPTNAKVAALEERFAGLAKTQDDFRATAAAAALSLASQSLRRAIADGRPFTGELAAIKAYAPAGLDLGALEAKSSAGVASLITLQRGFDAAAKAALDAARQPSDGSFGGELLAKARSLVRVRPTGDIAGSTPEAILARAEHGLSAGDVALAVRETSQLQGPAADVMKSWLAEASARAAADDALKQIEARLLASLAADERVRKGS